MKISGNELAVTVKKACIGAGVAQGVAVDMGQACLALALAERDSISALLSALVSFDKGKTQSVWKNQDDGWCIAHIDVLHSGPSVIDFARLAGPQSVVVVDECDQADLIWGLFAASGLPFSIEHEDKPFKAGFLDGTREPATSQAVGGLQIDDKKWAELQEFAKAILVPADDTNRADAGAGLTDND